MNKTNYHLYFGKAGHLFVMSEFLLRGWNVAIPEVDEGDDIFVVKHELGRLIRIQVKTSRAKLQKDGFSATFSLSTKQLEDVSKNDIFYVFLVRGEDAWERPIIISREALFENLVDTILISSSKNQTVRLSFKKGAVLLKNTDFTKYQNNFIDFEI
jgi:hypothetical protein